MRVDMHAHTHARAGANEKMQMGRHSYTSRNGWRWPLKRDSSKGVRGCVRVCVNEDVHVCVHAYPRALPNSADTEGFQ